MGKLEIGTRVRAWNPARMEYRTGIITRGPLDFLAAFGEWYVIGEKLPEVRTRKPRGRGKKPVPYEIHDYDTGMYLREAIEEI